MGPQKETQTSFEAFENMSRMDFHLTVQIYLSIWSAVVLVIWGAIMSPMRYPDYRWDWRQCDGHFCAAFHLLVWATAYVYWKLVLRESREEQRSNSGKLGLVDTIHTYTAWAFC